MHNLPDPVFRSKDHRNPQSAWSDILSSAKLGLRPLYPHNVGKLRGYVLRYVLNGNHLAISEIRCGTLQPLSNLLPSMPDRKKRVSEGYVISMREDVLHRLRVPFHEFTQRQVILLDQFVYIVYRSHLEITFIVSTPSFFSWPE
jgi:hypothetical protein